jgi:hypothetical protein
MRNALYGYMEADVLPLNYSSNLFTINYLHRQRGHINIP